MFISNMSKLLFYILQIITKKEKNWVFNFFSYIVNRGMVEAADGTWIYFDMVPGEYELREGQPEYTGRLCVIGCNLAQDRLLELFELV